MNKKVVASLRNVFDGIMIFMLFVGTTVYALPSNGVTYDNSTSGSSATNVGDAIDDLYSKLSIKDNEINRLKGIGNASSNTMLSGYTALVQGNIVEGSIPSKGATTYTPGTQNQTIASNQYLSGNQTIKGDANLVPQNIAKGKSIFGVSGTYTSDANAVAANILSGKTAYVNGSKITGSMPLRNGSSEALHCETGANGLYMVFPHGYYPSESHFTKLDTSEVYTSNAKVASAIGLTANKLANGQKVLGITGTYTSDANAVAANILSGKTAYVNGSKITGTMANNAGKQVSVTNTSSDTSYTYLNIPSSGYYDTNSKLKVESKKIAHRIELPVTLIADWSFTASSEENYARNQTTFTLVIENNKVQVVGSTSVTAVAPPSRYSRASATATFGDVTIK